MAEWTNDEGTVRVRSIGAELQVTVPGFPSPADPNPANRTVTLYKRKPFGETGEYYSDCWWRWWAMGGAEVEGLAAIADGCDILVIYTACRPFATGRPDDPRSLDADYRCGKLVERGTA